MVTVKQLMKIENCNNNAWINTLLDSMQVSSPTRRPSNEEDYKSWNLRHPSALSKFEMITAASKGKQIVVFLDYDGTLSPIVADPDCAFMSNEMREAVRDVATLFPTAIVSGRCRSKVYDFVGLSELYYAGSHGMDIKGPPNGHKNGNETVVCQPAKEFLPIIEKVCKVLTEKVKGIPGAKVEDNKFCLSVHFRCVDEKNFFLLTLHILDDTVCFGLKPSQRWGEVACEVKSVVEDYKQLQLSHGRMVLEIRPIIKWNKGNALVFLLESLGYGESKDVLSIYIGDDLTDEDAFRVLRERGQGVGILVSKTPKQTSAFYTLQEPYEVMQFLKLLVEWRKASCGH